VRHVAVMLFMPRSKMPQCLPLPRAGVRAATRHACAPLQRVAAEGRWRAVARGRQVQ